MEYYLYQILWKSVKWLSIWNKGMTHRQYGDLFPFDEEKEPKLVMMYFLFPSMALIENTQRYYRTFIPFTFILYVSTWVFASQTAVHSRIHVFWDVTPCCWWVVPEVVNHLPSDTASHLRRPGIFSNLLWEPQILQSFRRFVQCSERWMWQGNSNNNLIRLIKQRQMR
jgi:hypothetical protein